MTLYEGCLTEEASDSVHYEAITCLSVYQRHHNATVDLQILQLTSKFAYGLQLKHILKGFCFIILTIIISY